MRFLIAGGVGIKINKICILIVLGICLGGLIVLNATEAASPKEHYFKAEACYRELRTDYQKRKYRHNWMRCIEKFESVYRLNPTGPWAAAGLYVSAELYRELAKYSGKESDLNEALDIYERIIKRFPGSRYRQKAERAIDLISSGTTPKRRQPQKKHRQKNPQNRQIMQPEMLTIVPKPAIMNYAPTQKK